MIDLYYKLTSHFSTDNLYMLGNESNGVLSKHFRALFRSQSKNSKDNTLLSLSSVYMRISNYKKNDMYL